MIKFLLSSFFVFCALNVQAAQLSVSNTTASGTYNNDLSVLTDGIVPVPESWYTDSDKVYWEYKPTTLTFNMGSMVTVDDILIEVDNNDNYLMEYSTDGTVWNSLFTILSSYGYGGYSETMSSSIALGNYVSNIDFNSVTAQFFRLSASEGDQLYSVGEVQFYGTSSVSGVPEPESLVLMLTGMCFLGLGRKSGKLV